MRKNVRDGRGQDFKFTWFTKAFGNEWDVWREFAENWIAIQNDGLDHKMYALFFFLERYLQRYPQFIEPTELLRLSQEDVPSLMIIIEETVGSVAKHSRHNYAVRFVDWIIETYYSETDDFGVVRPCFVNPFQKTIKKLNRLETVYNPLPYTYVKELRTIICPQVRGDFCDWIWAQIQSGQTQVNGNAVAHSGDWFQVPESLIDKKDKDCVWRKRQRSISNGDTKQGNEIIYEMWSPARAMVIFIKLMLPLRTYQVRMLDSGEADTWRYFEGKWILNHKHQFRFGSKKSPYQKGIFKRIYVHDIGDVMTGLYISTNKTADRNKEEYDRGYTIPWQNEDVLFWLEKLRNWQEKYNPITEPLSFTEVERKHFGHTKSKIQCEDMGEVCFLFRNAAAESIPDKIKPILNDPVSKLWYRLLNELEVRAASRGQCLSDGSRLRFIFEYPSSFKKSTRTKTLFPLHSLRVSLLTCYALEGSVPAPVLSKLLAGHSRLLMTLYYTKITPATMSAAMKRSQEKIEVNEQRSLRAFLKDASMKQIRCKVVFHDEHSVEAVIANRNTVGWEYRFNGLCLVGGNTVKSDEMSSIGGCWNGGPLLKGRAAAQERVHGSVPHGPENCIRCRWFVTDATYLNALHRQFNQISYRASQAANIAVELEQQINILEDERYFAEEQDRPFTRYTELSVIQRRHDKQIVEADEYAKDLVSIFQLISRVLRIEQQRIKDDEKTKLIAVGSIEDIHLPLRVLETQSELWQLSMLCNDAEIYPDLADSLRKTPAIEKRSKLFNQALLRNGFAPIFLQMDDQMQLVAGNAMFREMAKHVYPENELEGYRRLSGLMETENYLLDTKLLEKGFKSLQGATHMPVFTLQELANYGHKNRQLEIETNEN
jgi:hypothetical protein